MNVTQTIKQTVTVDLGVALATATASVQADLASGTSISTPAIELTLGGHTYNVVISFALSA
jgi:hypothetical protein